MLEIKELREKQNMSQSEFAKEYKLSLRTLQRWEQGQTKVPSSTLFLLNRIFEVEKSKSLKYIPEELRYALWDVDFDKVDIIKDQKYIIPQMYCYGGFKGMRWVEGTYRKEDIIEAVKWSRRLNPIVANYLSQKFEIPKNEMRYYTIGSSEWR